MKRYDLTIVLPVYKEADRLPDTLKKVAEFIGEFAGDAEAVFVNDGSPDHCEDVLKEYVSSHPEQSVRYISYAVNQGKGYAVKRGVLEARGDLILMSDTDLSTPLHDYCKLLKGIQEGADIACGSRAVSGSDIGAPPPLLRRILSRVFNDLVRLSGVHGIYDTQCGFKLFKAEPAKKIFEKMRIRAFAFDVELIARARASGYRVVEIPVHWDYSGHSTVHVFSSGGRMLFDVFRLAVKCIFRGCRHLDVR
ncbi:MAG: glycosyltransferase family 2 protein [Kiritimatiellia bacterium]